MLTLRSSDSVIRVLTTAFCPLNSQEFVHDVVNISINFSSPYAGRKVECLGPGVGYCGPDGSYTAFGIALAIGTGIPTRGFAGAASACDLGSGGGWTRDGTVVPPTPGCVEAWS